MMTPDSIPPVDDVPLQLRHLPKFAPTSAATGQCREILLKTVETNNGRVWIQDIIKEHNLNSFAGMAFNQEGRKLQEEGKLRLTFDHHRGLWFISHQPEICQACNEGTTCHRRECQQMNVARDASTSTAHSRKTYKRQNHEYTRASMKEVDIETYINTGSKSGQPRKDWILAKAAASDSSKLDAVKLERVTKAAYDIIFAANTAKPGVSLSGPRLAKQFTADIKYMDIYLRTALVNLVSKKQVKALVPSDGNDLQVRWALGDAPTS